MTDTLRSTESLRPIYLLAGICAFLAMATNLLDLAFGFGETEVAVYGSWSAQKWLDLFSQNWFRGIYTLGIFNIVYMTLMVPVFVGLLAAHRETYAVSSAAVLGIAVLALAIYVATNAAVPMLVLSGKYAAAAPPERGIFIAAAEAVLARGEDFTPGAFYGQFAGGIGAIAAAVIMLRGGVFGKIHAWCGIVGFTFLSAFTFLATFVPAWYMFAYYFLGSIGGILALAWFFLTGMRFIRLCKA